MSAWEILKWERFVDLNSHWWSFFLENFTFSICGSCSLINNRIAFYKILARDGEQSQIEKWVNLIGDIAGCVSIKRPKEVI